jgi:hypothetical protein
LIKSQAGAVPVNEWPDLLANIANHPQAFPQELSSGLANLLGTNWTSKLSMLNYHGNIDPERILPGVLLFSIPAGLRGLILVALMAAAMSTFNAIINATTGFLTRDLYQGYLRKTAGNKELIYASYAFGVIVNILGFAMAYSTRSINDIWGWITMGLVGGVTVPTVLRLYWWRFNAGGFAIGTLIGLVAALLQRFFLPQMPELHQFIYILVIGTAGSIIGTYLTPPTEPDVLQNFYRTTKPFGLWQPLRSILGTAEKLAMQKEHRYDLISLPFALAWQITILMLPMQLILKQYDDVKVTSCLLIISLVGLYFFWYRHLPPAQKETA